MKIAKKQSKIPKRLIIAGLALAIVASAGIFGLYQSQRANNIASSDQDAVRPVNNVDYTAPTQDDQQHQDQTKEEIIKQNQQTSAPDSPISVTISRANQGGKGLPLNIRTIISGTTRGTCHVELKKDGQTTVTRSFPVIVQATYSTCQEADIPAADFSADGEWSLSITVKNETSTSNPAAGSATITR